MPKTNVIYVTYEEAQRLIPIFEYYTKEGPWKEVRTDARVIRDALKGVADRSYRPLRGMQIFLTEDQYSFFNDAASEIGS